jgi:hypothetical protein
MRINRLFSALLAVILLTTVADAADRFQAVLRDGSVVSGKNLPAWKSGRDRPKMAGKDLFDPASPVRFIHDTRKVIRRKGSYVVMAGGDILRGEVTGYLPANKTSGTPPQLMIALAGVVHSRDDRLRVRADRVLRIVRDAKRLAGGRPSTAILSDGPKLTLRSVRWKAAGAVLLTDDGVLTVPIDRLVDFYAPHVDGAILISENRDYPSRNPKDLIAQIAMTDGSVITYRRSLLISQRRAPKRGVDQVYQLIQPSWAMEAIYVPPEEIVHRGYRRVDEVPLSSLPAVAITVKDRVAQNGIRRLTWQRNRDAHRQTLASPKLSADVGIGMHAPSAVAFDLPAGARTFSTWVDLDVDVGNGGCVRCEVLHDKIDGKSLWTSGFIRGSDPAVRIGPLECDGAKRLILVANTAHKGRPSGADPLDIRDDVNWLFPMVQVGPDPDRSLAIIKRFLAGWSDWKVVGDPKPISLGTPRWSKSREGWLPTLRIEDDKGVTLSRSLQVTPRRDLIYLRATGSAGPPLELAVDGKKFPTIQIEHDGKQNHSWNLSSLHGQTVKLALHLGSTKRTGDLQWLGLGVGSMSKELLKKMPYGEISVNYWRQLEKSLVDQPKRRLALRKFLLMDCDPAVAGKWISLFYHDPVNAREVGPVAEIAELMKGCQLPKETEAEFFAKFSNANIHYWKVIGPFPNPGGAGHDITYGPELGPVRLGATYTLNGRKVRWIDGKAKDGRVDLQQLLKVTGAQTAYAVSWVYFPKKQSIELRLSSDNGHKLWIDRKLIATCTAREAKSSRTSTGTIYLSPGWHELLVKVVNSDPAWHFKLVLSAPNRNRPPEGTRYRQAPPKLKPAPVKAPAKPSG